MSELLPDELVWADGGHASDVVLRVEAEAAGCPLRRQEAVPSLPRPEDIDRHPGHLTERADAD